MTKIFVYEGQDVIKSNHGASFEESLVRFGELEVSVEVKDV